MATKRYNLILHELLFLLLCLLLFILFLFAVVVTEWLDLEA